MSRTSFPAVALAVLVLGACAGEPEPIRIAVASFQHETCTFCPGGDVTVEDWTRLDADPGFLFHPDEVYDERRLPFRAISPSWARRRTGRSMARRTRSATTAPALRRSDR